MPVIRIVGLEASERVCKNLIRDLKHGVASVKELGVTQEQVTPLIHTDVIQENPGEAIIVYVDGLFDKEERTPEVRQRLTQRIFAILHLLVKREHLTAPTFAEVIVHRTKPGEDGYYSGDVQNWKPE